MNKNIALIIGLCIALVGFCIITPLAPATV